MAFEGPGQPPSKKRRFFADPEDHCPGQPSSAPSLALPGSKKRFFQDEDDPPHVHVVDRASNTASPSGNDRRPPPSGEDVEVASKRSPAGPGGAAASPPVAFDRVTFENFVGDKVSQHVLDAIRHHCGNNLERAVNMYFDGTWQKLQKPSTGRSERAVVTGGRSSPSTTNGRPTGPAFNHHSMPVSRYIGAFGVEGWATRSGNHMIRHGDVVKIERQKIQPPQPTVPKLKGKSGAPAAVPKSSAAAARRVDIIVRFTNASGMEVGRLAKDTASWVSTLMDQKVCKFEAVCVYAPERLRTNDTIFLQVRCSLLRSAFDGQSFHLADNRMTGLFDMKETVEEKDLRLRQVALVRLFQEVGLMPTRTNAASAKHKRKHLLEAAEMAEKREKEVPRSPSGEREPPGSSPPSDEPEEGEELEQDQLDALYRKAQSFDFNTPEAEPADSFAMTLRPYQKQALHWMMAKEKDARAKDRVVSMHPLWEEYAWPTKDVDDKDLPQVAGQPTFYANPYSGDLSLEFPVQEQNCLGGILADEMGLGKTIQMLSLVHSHRSPVALEARRSGANKLSVNDLPRLPTRSATLLPAPCTTLVVAPMSLLAQWHSEAERASKEGTIKAMVYYGAEKNANLQSLCCEASASIAPDVIITSYGVVLSEFSQIAARDGDKENHHGLFSLKFFRVILDEAHTIKNRQSKTARACYEIDAHHRWVLTGTPIVNRLEDLFSLVRFLRVEPWNNFSFWRTFITVPFESKDFMRALDVVQTVLEPLVLRRTKDMKTPDGQPLVVLPPKHIEIVEVEMSKTERDVYECIYNRAKRTFSANVEAGTVMKAFTAIFAQILRLRQSCCHPILVRKEEIVSDEEAANAAADAAAGLADDMDLQSLVERFTAAADDSADSNAYGAHVLEQIRDEAVNECPICAEEPMVEQTVTGCWHSACKKCLVDYITHHTDKGNVPRCFNCREAVNMRDLFEVVRHDEDLDDVGPAAAATAAGAAAPPRISLQRLGVNNSSAKVAALVRHLRALRRERPRARAVVFSQFTSFLDLLEPALARGLGGVELVRLDGTMAQKARVAALDHFRSARRFCLLLISLRAGGVGLNLACASRVYVMDPWWSFAVEAQAIDRVHRMGQEDEVRVYRFIVRDSVEERMLRVQERKKFIATSLGMMTDEEKKLQRIEDIKELLG